MTTTPTTPRRIVRIVSVTDTREWVEDGDRWIAITGSGIENECHRCGRLHEVHAVVELEDGSSATVGTGCMVADDMDGNGPKLARSAASSAKTLARRRAELAALEAELERNRAVWSEVAALEPPSVEVEPDTDHRLVGRMGDAKAWSFESTWSAERTAALESIWRDHRAVERGGLSSIILANRTAKAGELKRQADRLAAKLAERLA